MTPRADSLSASLFRRLVPLSMALPLAFLLSGCSSHATSAESPAANEIQFTSASGLLTINVPTTWTDNTAALQEGTDANRGDTKRVEGGWLLSGDFLTGSAVDIFTIGGAGDSQAAAATAFLTDLAQKLGGATAPYSSVTTRAGLTFERGDYTISENGDTAAIIYLIAVVDGVGIVIGVALVNDDIAFEDEVIHAVETLVVN